MLHFRAENKIHCAERQRSDARRARLSREAYDQRRPHGPADRGATGLGGTGRTGGGVERRTAYRGPRRLAAPGPVLPCSDPEPRAPRVDPLGPISPSGPPPAEEIPSTAPVIP